MIGKIIERILVAALAAVIVAVIVVWMVLVCAVPLVLIELCGMVLLV